VAGFGLVVSEFGVLEFGSREPCGGVEIVCHARGKYS
jgi:hypothetical protein